MSVRVEVEALQRFYATPRGVAARRMIARRLAALWPHADGLDVLGLGFPGPYLEPFRASARRVIACMPAAQGAAHWPAESKGCVALAEEARLPFLDAIFDRVLLVHALEEAESARALLREIWRVTAPEGRILIVAANRIGVWAQAVRTPFGHGRPFSRRQLALLLEDCMWRPSASTRALYAPPFGWTAPAALAFERVGEALWPPFGGVVMMEAVKRLTASPVAPARQGVGAPALQPAPGLPAQAA